MTVVSAPFHHVDVFAEAPLTGNGLVVVLDADGWDAALMQRVTQEMRQFESIFLAEVGDDGASARIFTCEEELPFAGHPVLGAAAVLHRVRRPAAASAEWTLRLGARAVHVTTERAGTGIEAEMEQGIASWGPPVSPEAAGGALAALGLAPADLDGTLPVEVVSTGLPYLVVPVAPGVLARSGGRTPGLEATLARVGAKFAFLLDATAREGRTWDNAGLVEDVATGSAAGPVGAYLVRHGRASAGDAIALAQGRFAGRPSRLLVRVDAGGAVRVRGAVHAVAEGRFAFGAP